MSKLPLKNQKTTSGIASVTRAGEDESQDYLNLHPSGPEECQTFSHNTKFKIYNLDFQYFFRNFVMHLFICIV